MSGAYHFPDVMKNLTINGLNYYWTLCYHMPGEGLFSKCPEITQLLETRALVCEGQNIPERSNPLTASWTLTRTAPRGKQFHEWGQSVEFFTELVGKVHLCQRTGLRSFFWVERPLQLPSCPRSVGLWGWRLMPKRIGLQ